MLTPEDAAIVARYEKLNPPETWRDKADMDEQEEEAQEVTP